MELFDMELEKAGRLIEAAGLKKNDFVFTQRHLPPDPEDAVMFTARYKVAITHAPSGKTLDATGGIGLDWIGYFEGALAGGYFE